MSVSAISRSAVSSHPAPSLGPDQNLKPRVYSGTASKHHTYKILTSHPHINTNTMASNQEDLLPEETAGFKVGEKKTLNEIQSMGKDAYFLFSGKT